MKTIIETMPTDRWRTQPVEKGPQEATDCAGSATPAYVAQRKWQESRDLVDGGFTHDPAINKCADGKKCCWDQECCGPSEPENQCGCK